MEYSSRIQKELLLMLDLHETLGQLAMASSVFAGMVMC